MTAAADDGRRDLYERWLAEQDAADAAARPAGEELDFDAWRAEQLAARRRKKVQVFGQLVDVPASMSLDLAMRIDENRDSEDPELVQELVGELYGRAELERWRRAGASVEDFELLLAWGSARARGEDISFAEAAALMEKGRREQREGKAPANRAERRAQQRKKKRR